MAETNRPAPRHTAGIESGGTYPIAGAAADDSDFCLLRDFQCVINLYAKVPHC